MSDQSVRLREIRRDLAEIEAALDECNSYSREEFLLARAAALDEERRNINLGRPA